MEENRESMVMELGMYGPLAPRFFIVEGGHPLPLLLAVELVMRVCMTR